MKIAIGSDHAGFEQKEALKSYLEELAYDVLDCGPHTDDRVDYPDYAKAVAKSVADRESTFGVLVCGTGIGMCIAANKIQGVRAVNPVRKDFASLSRQHNDANILCLSGRFVNLEENKEILNAFLQTEFEGGRHTGRVQKIMALEDKLD